jgi:hypothetical protein
MVGSVVLRSQGLQPELRGDQVQGDGEVVRDEGMVVHEAEAMRLSSRVASELILPLVNRPIHRLQQQPDASWTHERA